MVSERNRILDLINYINSCGVVVNYEKNNARGHKGFFKVIGNKYQIDISKGLNEETAFSCLVHEFTHYIHYSYDKTLSSLSFIFEEDNDDLLEEMIKITVHMISGENIKPLFELKNNLKKEIKSLENILKKTNSDFKLSKPYLPFEKIIKKTPYKHLLKHDNVKVIDFFTTKVYSINNIEELKLNLNNEKLIYYLKIKSLQRNLKKINNRISKLNRYYNSHSELFARTIECYVCNKKFFELNAPILYKKLEDIKKTNKFEKLNYLLNI